jgi:hypothetical protein
MADDGGIDDGGAADRVVLLKVIERNESVSLLVHRYRGEKVEYTWSCLWDEIK